MTPSTPSRGDDGLEQLLADGLRHSVDRPVDEAALVSRARTGAARIRRRRVTAAGALALVVLVTPAWYGLRQATSEQTSAGSAAEARDLGAPASGSAPAAATSDSPMMVAGDAKSAASALASSVAPSVAPSVASVVVPSLTPAVSPVSPAPPGGSPQVSRPTTSNRTPTGTSVPRPSPTTASTASRTTAATGGGRPLPRTASGAVVVPAAALLTTADLTRVTGAGLRRGEDTGNAVAAPGPLAADLCGGDVGGLSGDRGSRAVTFRSATWSAGSTVRVFAGQDAGGYVGQLARQACLHRVTGPFQAGLVGHGRPDAEGRTHWFAVARSGRVLTEVRLVAPSGASTSQDDVLAVLDAATRRLTSSGLLAAAAADPSLG